jgi:hypothetical protein
MKVCVFLSNEVLLQVDYLIFKARETLQLLFLNLSPSWLNVNRGFNDCTSMPFQARFSFPPFKISFPYHILHIHVIDLAFQPGNNI